MQKSAQKKKHFHTLINLALSAFLILTATIGMRSLTYTGDYSLTGTSSSLPQLENVMVCAIGQCAMM
ncbi:hypothetical protein [Pseudemcibacter aquimaris]|uniref:hypothetical protein n=1 Tax=Pseudemcibacter aquimaris TaxID=2857064 RepID=UPI0020133AF5|nr:hypothetical protein [Pseudemcibacter aquimaris]MCC3862138.1 hypothetical protein [Pseudemcibacter aquimaris]WDU58891.1 hypothetical protein KW060_01210 [Pseudemcibacter aquimaris]